MVFLEYCSSTWEEFNNAISQPNSLMLIPIGCLEEHGPHLPINTDNIIAQQLSRIVVEKTDIILGPELIYGVARSTQGFSGTIELKMETLQNLIFDILYSFCSQGVKKIILFTWHGGESHRIALKETCINVLEAFRKERGLSISLTQEEFDLLPQLYILSGVRLLNGALTEKIMEILETEPYHAGELETSLMLYLFPDLVKKEKMKSLKEFPKFPEDRIFIRSDIWLSSGVMGNPSKSTAEKGEKIFNIFIDALTEKINKIKAT